MTNVLIKTLAQTLLMRKIPCEVWVRCHKPRNYQQLERGLGQILPVPWEGSWPRQHTMSSFGLLSCEKLISVVLSCLLCGPVMAAPGNEHLFIWVMVARVTPRGTDWERNARC